MSSNSVVGDLLEAVANYPRPRPDGDLGTRIHPYRKMLSFMMPGRNESVVYFDDYPRADALLDYIKRKEKEWGTDVNVTHLLVAAAARGLYNVPTMNQFVVGKRLYKRNHVAVTFTMKRKRMNKKAKLAAVKLRFDEDEPLEQICRRINDKINVERTDKKTYTDKELGLLTALPRPLLSGALSTVRWLDYYNLLPGDFIHSDAFYTSMVIANLGSLGMGAGFHHLYEYGTCPLFMMVGKVEQRPQVVDGEVVPVRSLHIRWSYDERIDDGLTSNDGIRCVREALENPDEVFG